jgi:hypothetical protein
MVVIGEVLDFRFWMFDIGHHRFWTKNLFSLALWERDRVRVSR